MPGLAIAAGAIDGSHVQTLLLGVMSSAGYRTQPLFAGPSLAGAYAAPPAYPLISGALGGTTWALEGAVYGSSPATVHADIERLAALFERDRVAAREAAERWASATDGDFVALFAHPASGHALVVNDRLGRLPLYSSATAGRAVVAREIKCVREVVGTGDVDRLAIAQLLMFSFPLGDRTLHDHIARVPEAASVAIDASRGAIDVRRYHHWDFEQMAGEEADAAGLAGDLADRFVERCAALGAWAEERPLVVAMSGGLDSRSTGAGLARAGVHFECVTFESGRRGASEESATASLIAEALGAQWRLYALAAPAWSQLDALARRCDGTTNVGMAFMEEYFDRLRADFGPSVCQATGDGGDRALPDLSDRAPCADRASFASRLIESAMWPIDTVARLLRISVDAIAGSVRAHVDSYPERSPQWWTVRHLIADYGWGRIFSGEDRSRSYAWTMTPFYCQSFFDAAMRAPLKAKRDYALYAGFLRKLDPRVADVKKSDWGFAPTSPMVRVRAIAEGLRAGAPAPLRKALGSMRRQRSHQANNERTKRPEFVAAVSRRPNSVFDAGTLREIAERGCGKTHFHMLATALLYVDGVWRQDAKASSG